MTPEQKKRFKDGLIGYSTASNPSKPGEAKLEFFDNDGTIFWMTFNKEEWEQIDGCMRDSMSKYQN